MLLAASGATTWLLGDMASSDSIREWAILFARLRISIIIPLRSEEPAIRCEVSVNLLNAPLPYSPLTAWFHETHSKKGMTI
jgi:hypothetical protein